MENKADAVLPAKCAELREMAGRLIKERENEDEHF